MNQDQQGPHVVCVGGGHVNCQVLKIMKKRLPPGSKLTVVSNAPCSYYSGMLPGSVAKLYDPKDITVELAPVAAFCKAEAIIKEVVKVEGNKNTLHFRDGTSLTYDVLALDVGSRTRGTYSTPGVKENTLATRPINELLPRIEEIEKDFMNKGVTPTVVIVGGGAAGVELAFTFKQRWEKYFGKELSFTLATPQQRLLESATHGPLRQEVERKLVEAKIKVVTGAKVKEIKEEGAVCEDGNVLKGNMVVWATGAEPHDIETDLNTQFGYFQVNDFMQSTSHPNVFAGGDCVTMATYAAERFPPKAGVYAVRAGPIIAENVSRFLDKQELTKYIPQREFLALLALGDEKAIGTKFGIAFTGKWVWKMKDYIDVSFMKLFYP